VPEMVGIIAEENFVIVPRFVGEIVSGKKAFIALGLTAGKKTAPRVSRSPSGV